MSRPVYVGTSGWIYPDWAGSFYPGSLKQTDWLPFYSQHFPAVEVNMSFYRFPTEKVLDSWYRRTPDGFLLALKAHRLFTHLRRLDLSDPQTLSSLTRFLDSSSRLGEKQGPVLFQTPPALARDDSRLEDFLTRLVAETRPRKMVVAVEFRHASWFCDAVFCVLDRFGVGTVVVGAPRIPMVSVRTGPLGYIRVHGIRRWYDDSLTPEELDRIAGWVREYRRKVPVHVYFDNTAGGQAVENARQLQRLVDLSGSQADSSSK